MWRAITRSVSRRCTRELREDWQVFFEHRNYLRDGDVAAEFYRQRGDAGIGDAARHYRLVRRQVWIAVEGEAVQGNPACDADPDRRDLACTKGTSVGLIEIRRHPH